MNLNCNRQKNPLENEMLLKKNIIISSLIAIVAVAGISITFVILLNNSSKANEDIYDIQDVLA
jgi:hypothetical protein